MTRDGRRIEVVANVGGPDEIPAALAAGAEGVGLFRTEFLFLGRMRAPDEEEQRAAYAHVAATLGDRRLVLRTLDAGADKPDPGIFRLALERLGTDPARTLHVGDDEVDAEGAARAGLAFRPAPLATVVEELL